MSSLASATSKMFSGTLVSRILGQVRLIVLLAALGVTGQADAFQVANTLPNTIYMLLAGGVLNAILVPQIVRALKRRDDTYVNRLLTMAGVLLFGVTVVLTAASSILITVFASQLAPEWFHLAVAFAFWCIPQVFFYGLYTLLGNVLNARGSFGPYMWAPVVNNIIAIAGLVAYIWLFGGADAAADPAAWTSGRIAMVGGVATFGVACQALVLIVPLRRSGFRFRFAWSVRGSGLGTASSMAGWTFAALAVGQIGNLVLVNVGSAANGAAQALAAEAAFVPTYTAYTSAFALYMLPQSLITTSLVTAMFTRMSHHAAERDLAGVRSDLSLGLRVVGLFTVFAAAAFMVLAIPLVQAVLPSISPGSAVGFAAVLVALSVGIPAQGVWTMAQRVSYAFEDARTLFYIQIPMAAIVVAGGVGVFVAPPQWWVVIMATASSLSMYFGGLVGYLALRLKLRRLDGATLLRSYLRILLAVIPSALIGWGLLTAWGPVSDISRAANFGLAVLKVLVVGGIMAAIYFGMLRALKVSELDMILAPLTRRLSRILPISSLSRGAGRTMKGETEGGASVVVPVKAGELFAARFRFDAMLYRTESGAELWDGHDTVLDRSIWVLVAPPEIRDTVLDSARRAAILTDPRLARIIDIGEADGAGYVISDRPDGTSAGGLTVPDETARAIVGETAAALNTARKRGVHHGALTPDCVTILPTGEVIVSGLGFLAAAGRPVSESDPLPDDEGALPESTPPADATAEAPPAPPGAGPVELPDAAEVALHDTAGARRAGQSAKKRASAERALTDVAALLALRTSLSGVSEPSSATTAGALMQEMTPWGEIVLPKKEKPAAIPLWRRLRGPKSGAEPAVGPAGAISGPTAVGGPAAAASVGTGAGIGSTITPASLPSGPSAAMLDTSDWGLPLVSHHTDSPSFDAIFEGENESERATAPLHAGTSRLAWLRNRAPTPETDAAAPPIEASDAAAVPAASSDEADDGGPGTPAPSVLETSEITVPDAETAAGEPTDGEPSFPRTLVGTVEGAVSAAGAAAGAVGAAAGKLTRGGANLVKSAAGRAREGSTKLAGKKPRLENVVEHIHVPGQLDIEGNAELPLRRRQLDPGPFIIAIVVIGVIAALMFALSNLRGAGEPVTLPPREDPTPTAVEEEEPAEEGEDAAEEEPADIAAEPAIAAINVLDPEGDGAENQDLTPRALDGDRDTFWRSRSYVNPQFGMKTGIGLDLELEEPALVTEIELTLNGSGGHVQVKADPESAARGEVIVEADMEATTVIALPEPTEMSNVVLWFTHLPVANSDGKNRVELIEVAVR